MNASLWLAVMMSFVCGMPEQEEEEGSAHNWTTTTPDYDYDYNATFDYYLVTARPESEGPVPTVPEVLVPAGSVPDLRAAPVSLCGRSEPDPGSFIVASLLALCFMA